MIKINSIRYVSVRKNVLLAVVAAGLAAIGTGALPAPPAALADPPPPMERCRQNMTPDVTQTVTHYGNQMGASFPDGANPPNGIFRGDVVKVTITGSVRIDYWNSQDSWYGPVGQPVTARHI